MDSKPNDIACDSPVTIIVKRQPKPGMEQEFEAVMTGTTRDSLTFEGHLGVNIIRPTFAGDVYRIVFKFDSLKNYMAWENSSVRQRWLERYADVSTADTDTEILSGLETWFTLPGAEVVVPPPKYKMLTVIWLGIFPLSLLMHYFIQPYMSSLPIILQLAIVSFLMVLLMTYSIMPLISRLLHRWLHCQK